MQLSLDTFILSPAPSTHVLTHLSALAIEVTQDKKEIIDLLIENGFKIVDIDTLLVNSNDNTEINLFAEK